MIAGIETMRRWFTPPPVPEDVTNKQINKDIVRVVAPSFVELFLMSLTSMVDLMMVGGLGAWAVSAVGLTNQPIFILQAIFLALNSGATALVARFRGMEDKKMANATMRQTLLLTLVMSIFMSALWFVLSEPLMVMMGAEDDTLVPATKYLVIQSLGFPITALTMTVTAVLRGIGNTRVPMFYNIIANVFNVIFNYALIYGKLGFPQMGIEGASLSTIIARSVALVIALWTLFQGKGYLGLRWGDSFKPDFPLIGRICKIGLPAMLEQVIMRVGMLLYVRTVSSLGTIAFSTHNIAMNLLNFTFMNGQAFSIASTTFVGQNLGKGRRDLALPYVRNTRRMGMIAALVLGVALVVFGKPILSLYMIGDTSPDVPLRLNMGAQLLWIVAFVQPLQSSQMILNGALRGAGDTLSTAIIMGVGVLILRPILSYVFVYPLEWGLVGAWVALALDQAVRSVISYIIYQRGKWMYIRV